jgi:hypothetical protein
MGQLPQILRPAASLQFALTPNVELPGPKHRSIATFSKMLPELVRESNLALIQQHEKEKLQMMDEREVIADELKKKNEELEKKDEKIAEAITQLNQAAQQAAEFARQNDELRASQEAESREHERTIQEKQKLLESKEQVAVRNFREIQGEYEALKQQAQSIQDEQERVAAELAAENQKSTDLMRLAENLEIRRDIAAAEAGRLLKKFHASQTEHQGTKAEKLILEANIRKLEGEIRIKNTELRHKDNEIGRREKNYLTVYNR